VSPEQISYIEAHGTGTPLGDPIEVESLTAVIGQRRRDDNNKCLLGSVKTNIGHLEAAAGIAGLIKVVLSLQHREIPPHLHFQEMNPNISLENTPFVVPMRAESWRSSATTRCVRHQFVWFWRHE
jgi:acyl transferase domain-containing protein